MARTGRYYKQLPKVVVGDDECDYVVRRDVIPQKRAIRHQSTLMVPLSSRACVAGAG